MRILCAGTKGKFEKMNGGEGERGVAVLAEKVIDLLLQWDGKGYIQLKISHSQLHQKLTKYLRDLKDDLITTDSLCVGEVEGERQGMEEDGDLTEDNREEGGGEFESLSSSDSQPSEAIETIGEDEEAITGHVDEENQVEEGIEGRRNVGLNEEESNTVEDEENGEEGEKDGAEEEMGIDIAVHETEKVESMKNIEVEWGTPDISAYEWSTPTDTPNYWPTPVGDENDVNNVMREEEDCVRLEENEEEEEDSVRLEEEEEEEDCVLEEKEEEEEEELTSTAEDTGKKIDEEEEEVEVEKEDDEMDEAQEEDGDYDGMTNHTSPNVTTCDLIRPGPITPETDSQNILEQPPNLLDQTEMKRSGEKVHKLYSSPTWSSMRCNQLNPLSHRPLAQLSFSSPANSSTTPDESPLSLSSHSSSVDLHSSVSSSSRRASSYFTAPLPRLAILAGTPTPGQSPLRSSIYYTAQGMPPSPLDTEISVSSHTTPSNDSTPSQSLVQCCSLTPLHSPSISHHSTPRVCSSPPSAFVSSSSPSPFSPPSPFSLPPSPCSPNNGDTSPSPPPSRSPNNADTSVIILESSDEEEADNRLENLFSEMRIRSRNESEKASVHKGLTVIIVSDDSEEEEEEEEEEDEDSIGQSEPSSPDTTATSLLSPVTPLSGVSWTNLDPGPLNHRHHHHQTEPIRRYPLAERNLPITVAGVRTGARKKAPPPPTPPVLTTPSAHKSFSRNKKVMAAELYELFNRSVFDNQLPSDLEMVWNAKLRTTAGCCRNSGLNTERRSLIELSTKVTDTYERLKNTLIHEMCHAAVWTIDGIKHGGHQKEWRAWAAKANLVHPDLEPITTCHNYDIAHKFQYKCTRCDFMIGRHSKSVNLVKARCPYCLSELELKGGSSASTTKLNRYAQFVKDHYADVKLQTPVGGHKAVMENLRQKYHSIYKPPPPKLDFDD